LVIGIAFRDITENYLASIVLSMRRPFLTGDLVRISDVLGYVQSLNTRTTVLMALSGNYVEIPNSKVYNSTIFNFTTNSNRREDFTVGIGYDVAIADAQELALKVMRDHPAVLNAPEPWALVDSLGSAVVVLRMYFWIDGSKHSFLKVKSALIRLVKGAFQDAGIDMPDEAREVVFPRGVPVQMISREEDSRPAIDRSARREVVDDKRAGECEPRSTEMESDLSSDAENIEEQARGSRQMGDENLLNEKSKDLRGAGSR
jgi:small-conductance mechanosensitive channel